jgi:hypothetical protein
LRQDISTLLKYDQVVRAAILRKLLAISTPGSVLSADQASGHISIAAEQSMRNASAKYAQPPLLTAHQVGRSKVLPASTPTRFPEP